MRVIGLLDLSNIHSEIGLEIAFSLLPDGVTLESAQFNANINLHDNHMSFIDLSSARILGQLNLSGTKLDGTVDEDGYSIFADNLQVGDEFLLARKFRAAGAVRISGAKIAHQLNLSGAHINGVDAEGESLTAGSIDIGPLHLDDHFRTAGSISLSGSHVRGQVVLRSAHLGADNEGDSLIADNLVVDHDMLLDGGITTSGAVRLPGARVLGQLNIAGAAIGMDSSGDSLVADYLFVGNNLVMNANFVAEGAIRLPSAQVDGQANLAGVSIRRADSDGDSLIADGLKVSEHLVLTKGITVAGTISLKDAELGALSIDLSKLSPMPDSAVLELDRTSIRYLEIDMSQIQLTRRRGARRDFSTPRLIWITLENCTFLNRPNDQFGSLSKWLDLLRHHTPGYQPSAYQQLGTVHRATGHERDAAAIFIAQQDHRRAEVLWPAPHVQSRPRPPTSTRWSERRAAVSLWLNRAGLGILKASIGYGYRPVRAVLALLLLMAAAFAMALLVTHTTDGNGAADVAMRPAAGTHPASKCSSGEMTGLALRIAVPLVNNLAQGTCSINTSTTTGGAYTAMSWILQACAWILGAIVAGAAARSIRRNP